MGNQQDYGFRIYDPRIGKFLSVDPLTKSYPWYTPYQFASNTPIQTIDLDGLEAKYVREIFPDGTTIINITVDFKIKNSSGKNLSNANILMFAKAMSPQIENMYNVVDVANKTTYALKVGKLSVTDKIDPSKDFAVELVNWEPTTDGTILGYTGEIGNAKNNYFQLNINNSVSATEIVRTSGHELGHELGLRHPINTEDKTENSDPASETTV